MTSLQLADKDRAVFTAVASEPAPPGTIVRDFDTFLDCLGTDGIPVSPKTYEFAIARLPELNARLTRPPSIGFSRGRQVSYPHVDGLHMLLLVSRLCKVDRSLRTPQIVQDKAMVARWQLLNPTERYFSLLERWWNIADFEQDRFGLAASRLVECRCTFLKRHRPGSRAKERDEKWQVAMLGLLGMKQVALMQLFGLLDITADDAFTGEGWKIRRMVATPWGLSASRTHFQSFRHTTDSLLKHLLNPTSKNSTPYELEAEEEMERHPFLLWASRVLPFFPACRHYLGDPEATEPFQGSVVLKVSLDKDTWRRIVMPAGSDFDDLARFILDTFQFDDEHLYQFRYQDEYATQRTFDDPRCSDVEDDYADEVTLGEAGLFPKQLVEFRYDFGDDWRFQVLVEKLDASETGAKPTLLAKEGKAPRQYQ